MLPLFNVSEYFLRGIGNFIATILTKKIINSFLGFFPALLYDLLINTVYPEIDQLEEERPAVETSSWTQVNANKIKSR